MSLRQVGDFLHLYTFLCSNVIITSTSEGAREHQLIIFNLSSKQHQFRTTDSSLLSC